MVKEIAKLSCVRQVLWVPPLNRVEIGSESLREAPQHFRAGRGGHGGGGGSGGGGGGGGGGGC